MARTRVFTAEDLRPLLVSAFADHRAATRDSKDPPHILLAALIRQHGFGNLLGPLRLVELSDNLLEGFCESLLRRTSLAA